MSLPFVSVIIPTYNRSKYLEVAIKSVVNQTFKNFEVLVVDDGSSNNYAKKICNKYKNCFYFYKKNGGVSSARNFGVKKAKGDYIAFLDDDDLWIHNKLEIQVNFLNKNKRIDCIHSGAIVIDEKGLETGKIIGASPNKMHKRSGYVFWNALGTWLVKASSPLIRKSVFNENLFFDETLEVGEDFDFYQRMFYKHKVYYYKEPFTYYREYNSNDRLSLQTKEYLGIEKKIFDNFLKMGIRNPFVLNRIASKLLFCSVKRFNEIYINKKIDLNFFDKYIFPQKKLELIKFKND